MQQLTQCQSCHSANVLVMFGVVTLLLPLNVSCVRIAAHHPHSLRIVVRFTDRYVGERRPTHSRLVGRLVQGDSPSPSADGVNGLGELPSHHTVAMVGKLAGGAEARGW
jgi:hypothetical protein